MFLKRRRQLFEFSDLPLWPRTLRTYALDYLRAVAERYEPFSAKTDVLLRAMDAVGTEQIVDLASGSGGPWPHLAPQLSQARGRPVRLSLSDKYPNIDAAPALDAIPGASYVPESVDARHVPAHLAGLRTLLNGFHHFPPAEAQEILQDAVRNNQPIAVFEMLARSWPCLAFMLITPLLVLLITPKIRPFRLSRIVLTFLIPLVPLCMFWDSVVSVLRCYTTHELAEMTARLDGPSYAWDVGTYRRGPVWVTYLVGYPQPGHPSADRDRP